MNKKYLEEKIKKEGDKKVFEYLGLTCVILRHSSMLHLCGYVVLKPEHRFYQVDYDDIDADVHGGLTYGSQTLRGFKSKNAWIIGFDCAHDGDCEPKYPEDGGQYRDMLYVENELKRLVDQLQKKG